MPNFSGTGVCVALKTLDSVFDKTGNQHRAWRYARKCVMDKPPSLRELIRSGSVEFAQTRFGPLSIQLMERHNYELRKNIDLPSAFHIRVGRWVLVFQRNTTC